MRAAPARIVVMGVAGSGKTVVGEALASELGYPFLDADDFHPKSNVDRMSRGIPLTDEDRWPWLDAVGTAIAAREHVVAACSALRMTYRDRLREFAPDLVFVELDGSRELLAQRIGHRTQHFMPSALLDSQLATLERLAPGEAGVTVDVAPAVAEVVRDVRRELEAGA